MHAFFGATPSKFNFSAFENEMTTPKMTVMMMNLDLRKHTSVVCLCIGISLLHALAVGFCKSVCTASRIVWIMLMCHCYHIFVTFIFSRNFNVSIVCYFRSALNFLFGIFFLLVQTIHFCTLYEVTIFFSYVYAHSKQTIQPYQRVNFAHDFAAAVVADANQIQLRCDK